MKTEGGGIIAEASNRQELLRQNLLDAGCDPVTVRQCMELARQKKPSELLRILSGHRRALLDRVHRNEKRIDCLDYLVYQIEKSI